MLSREFEHRAYITQRDWTLHRQGHQDEARHNEKVKEAIKDNLPNIISDGDIISVDPKNKKIIKVPMRSLELPKIRYGDNKEGVGSGDGSEKVGDVIDEGFDPSRNKETGNQPGVEYYEAEITFEELIKMAFEDLGLPHLMPKMRQEVESEQIVFDDIRRKRSLNNLDLMRTMAANLERNAQEKGRAFYGEFIPEDLRNKSWRQEVREENNAVFIAMRDISGSMGDYEVYISRIICIWTNLFLRTKYPRVDLAFIAHDTQAYEVSERQFFERGAGGGTLCSSANEKALDLVLTRYPIDQNNVYIAHLSDGDTWGNDDERRCAELVNTMLGFPINQYVYYQIGSSEKTGLMAEYRRSVKNQRFESALITKKEDVWPALKRAYDPAKRIN